MEAYPAGQVLFPGLALATQRLAGRHAKVARRISGKGQEALVMVALKVVVEIPIGVDAEVFATVSTLKRPWSGSLGSGHAEADVVLRTARPPGGKGRNEDVRVHEESPFAPVGSGSRQKFARANLECCTDGLLTRKA